ncbi:MAG: hypothetical protein ACRC92_20795 [Peptostreptococcaceae bacterium]
MKSNRVLIVLICVLTLALIGLSSFTIYVFVNHSANNNTNTFIQTSQEKDKTLQTSKDNSSPSKQENIKQPSTNKKPSKENKLYTCDICSTKTENVLFVDDYTLCILCNDNIHDFLSPCINCQKMKPNEDMYNSDFCKKCYEHNYDPPSQDTYICDSCNKNTDSLVNVDGSSLCSTCEKDYWSTFVVCNMCHAHVFECEITSGGMCINCSDKLNSQNVNDDDIDEGNQDDSSDEIIN